MFFSKEGTLMEDGVSLFVLKDNKLPEFVAECRIWSEPGIRHDKGELDALFLSTKS